MTRRFPSSPSRRAFLSGLGALSLSPFLPLLNASGAEALFPKRLVLVFTPHGTVKRAWTPTGTVSDFTLSPILQPLARHQKKIVVVSGVNMQDVGVGAPHTKGLPLLWTGSRLLDDGTFARPDGSGGFTYGWNSSASVDQIIAGRIGGATAYPTLEFGVRSGGSNPASRMVYAGARQPLAPATDPWAQYARLFVGYSDQTARERLSAIDLVNGELQQLVPRIATSDRIKLNAHLDALNSLGNRLKTKQAACAGPQLGERIPSEAVDNTPQVIDHQIELIAAALACDLTRICTLQYTLGDNDNAPYPWLGISDGHHELTHAPDSDTASWDKVIKIRTWYADRFAYLLDCLAAVPEGDGSLLDNTMVVWGSELGMGNTHSFRSTPFVVAGGASGAFQTGRYLEFNETLDHNRLLVAICHAMGLVDIDSFGDTDAGKGPLPGLLS